jgi:Na+-driven multidrug efflux pump
MFLIWWNAETILLFLRQEPEVAHLASTYLRWVSLGLPGMEIHLFTDSILICFKKLMPLTVSVGTYTRLSAIVIVPNPQ